MTLGIWIALLVFFAYVALASAANRSGWLERHNMTLVIGLIIMWRTRRGKGFIERLSGRGSPTEILSGALEEFKRERVGLVEEVDRARGALQMAADVGRYWDLEAEMAPLRERRNRAQAAHRELDSLGAEVDAAAAAAATAAGAKGPMAALEAAAPEGLEALEDAYITLKDRMYTIESAIPPDSRFSDMLHKGGDAEVRETLRNLVSDSRGRAEEFGAKLDALTRRIHDEEARLQRLEATGDANREARKMARRLRFWKAYGTFSIGLILFFMFSMLALLLWQAFVVVRIPPGVIKPQQMLGIPGINPVIPLWYGVIGLIVAMVVHELAHGVLTRVGKVPVKSIGLLLLVVPIGAFVEPDEEALGKVDRARRSRVFAVGPVTNILVAMVSALLFAWVFMGSLEPAVEGVVINNIISEQDLPTGNNTTATNQTPAAQAGLRPWCIITRIEALDGPPLGMGDQNASVIRDYDDFIATMDRTQAGQRVRITWWYDGVTHVSDVTLWDKGLVLPGEGYEGKGYLGSRSLLIPEVPAGEMPNALAHPLRYSEGALGFRNVTFFYISLPFTSPSLAPAPKGITQAFRVTGPLAGLGDTWFWLLSNLLYWVFWLNIMVGIFNSLPAIPLDGGYIFRDGLSTLVQRLSPKGGAAKAEGVALRVTGALSMLVLVLILWQFLGPYIGAAMGL